MKYFAVASAALLATTGLVQAGGLERDTGSMAILFEEGTYAELGFTYVAPSVSGVQLGTGAESGDMLESYVYGNLAFRSDITDNLSYAIVASQPYGADVNYPAGTPYPFQGTTAQVDSTQLSVILRYEFGNGFSAYGGLRTVEATGQASIPVLSYSLDVSGSTELGYVVGAAYERPDIGMRIALTYQSATEHTFSGTEYGAPTPDFKATLPQSLTLEAQSGIAANTLVFGSVRWVDWSEFALTPAGFRANPGTGGNDLSENSEDVITYRVGVARRFNDNWVGLASVTYEPNGTGSAGGGAFMGNLDPRDGRVGLGIGARWESDSGLSISGGVEYIRFGNADTARVSAPTTQFADFDDNTGYAAAIRIGYQF